MAPKCWVNWSIELLLKALQLKWIHTSSLETLSTLNAIVMSRWLWQMMLCLCQSFVAGTRLREIAALRHNIAVRHMLMLRERSAGWTHEWSDLDLQFYCCDFIHPLSLIPYSQSTHMEIKQIICLFSYEANHNSISNLSSRPLWRWK